MRREVLASVFLTVAVLAAYGQVHGYGFVDYDDPWIVSENPHLRDGLTVKAIVWAFTDSRYDWWHPLTWLSHLVDIQLFGMNPGPHHLTNLVLHLTNALMLFYVVQRMTRGFWSSFFVAALFALHPLHVESVAWVTERKDVLSTLFWILTMLAYCFYVERPGIVRYLLALLAFLLGLMAKPMLVTVPFVLLLLDFWPLKRTTLLESGNAGSPAEGPRAGRNWGNSNLTRLILEKVPFLVFAVVSTVVTIIGQQRVGGMAEVSAFPMGTRIANALCSYVAYLAKTIWPSHLAVFYPFPSSFPAWKVMGAALLLLGITVWVVWACRKYPYLLVGWLWYLGTLLPVIGLIQVGDRAMADRFTYVPLVGVFVMVAWGLPEVLARWKQKKVLLGTAAGIAIAASTAATWVQVRHWKDTSSLFEHALAVTKDNHIAHINLGIALASKGKAAEAISHYREALRIKPSHPKAHNNLGVALVKQDKLNEALTHYAQAMRLKPDYVEAHYNMGLVLFRLKRYAEAIERYSEALRLKPDYAEAHVNLGLALISQGDLNGAEDRFRQALRLKPGLVQAHYGLGGVLERRGQYPEAISHLEAALRLKPNFEPARAALDRIKKRSTKPEASEISESNPPSAPQ